MKANFKQRCIAYIIDFLFLASCLMIISNFSYKTDTVKNYEQKLDTSIEKFISHEINLKDFIKDYTEYNYRIDYNNSLKNVLNLVLIISYFMILPLFLNGQTLGKKLMKIRIVDETGGKVKISSMFIRTLIINALAYNILTFIFILFIDPNIYFISVIILSICQLILVFISSHMILYKENKLGLQDILSRSKVIFE